jgi:O-acetylhomoserine (thiol)-lyase
MTNNKNMDETTRLLHYATSVEKKAGTSISGANNFITNAMPTPIVTPIGHAAAYTYENAHTLSNIYQNKAKGLTYGRTGNGNTQEIEAQLNALEQGIGCVCFSTGMAAYDAMFFTLLSSGDHVIASKFLFANSISLLKSYSKRFGIELTFVDVTCVDAVKNAYQHNTRIILLETIANPCTQIPVLKEIGIFAQQKQIIYIVDNTLTTPTVFKPISVGASLIIHSLTKSSCGHSRALGGAVIDTGLFDWVNIEHIEQNTHTYIEPAYQNYAKNAYLMQLRKKGLRDKGATLTAQHADLIAIGLETLHMRVHKANQNANALAAFLHQHACIAHVCHPSLSTHLQHSNAQLYFAENHYGTLMSFDVQPHIDAFQFLQALQIIINCSSIGDNRSLIIHPASTIFSELSAQQRLEMGISEQTFRLSVGIEHIEDLKYDIEQAFNARLNT